MLVQEGSAFSKFTHRDQDQINAMRVEVIKYPTKSSEL
jgi:hypothetical protein